MGMTQESFTEYLDLYRLRPKNKDGDFLYNSLPKPLQDYINSLRIPVDISFTGSFKIKQFQYINVPTGNIIQTYFERKYGFKINLNNLTDSSSGICYGFNGSRYHISKYCKWDHGTSQEGHSLQFKFVTYKQSLPPILTCIKKSSSWELYIPLERGPISIFSINIAKPYLVTTENKDKINSDSYSYKNYPLEYKNYIDTSHLNYSKSTECYCNNYFS